MAQGYIYILIRADFIKDRKYVYKIGQTMRYPPHQRLWDYPYGSLFVCVLKVDNPIKYEKQIKEQLSRTDNLIWRTDIGVEYFEGDLQMIIDIIVSIYPSFQLNGINLLKLLQPVNPTHYLSLNRIRYFPYYDDAYFSTINQCQLYVTDDIIDQELVYQSYLKFLKWYPAKYPENYILRKGNIPK